MQEKYISFVQQQGIVQEAKQLAGEADEVEEAKRPLAEVGKTGAQF